MKFQLFVWPKGKKLFDDAMKNQARKFGENKKR